MSSFPDERGPKPSTAPRSKALQRGSAILASGLRRLGAGPQVVVGYSGGADSLALLILLRALPRRLRPKVEAIHVDHGLRPESSDDAKRAAALARQLGFSCRIVRLDRRGAGEGGGVEAWARRERYAALAEAAGDRPILTAHTADDQAETVLYRLAKGAGTRGIAGIRPKVRLGEALIIRPLLEADRGLLHQIVKEHGLEAVEDPSNQTLDFVRNRLRHLVLPALEEAIPNATSNLARAARHASDDERYLARRAAKAMERLRLMEAGVDAKRLTRLPAALRGRIVRELILQAGGRIPSAERVEEILEIAARGGEIHLPGGIKAVARGGILELIRGPTGRRE